MAIRIAGQYQEIAEKRQESALLLETCQLVGIPRFYMGEFEQARRWLERGVALYDAKQHHAQIFEHGGADTGVAIMTHEALAVWALGFPDQARQKMDAALICARVLAHPFTLAFALLQRLAAQAVRRRCSAARRHHLGHRDLRRVRLSVPASPRGWKPPTCARRATCCRHRSRRLDSSRASVAHAPGLTRK